MMSAIGSGLAIDSERGGRAFFKLRPPIASGICEMRIDFLGLQAFVSIAERGSFLDAARHLNLSPTALSHRIRKLEEDLGADLLVRAGRNVSLTSAGAELLPKARRSMEDLAQSLGEVRFDWRKRTDTLAFGCLPTVASSLLPPLLVRFKEHHPDLRLRIHDRPASEIAALVASGDIEFGLSIDFNLAPTLQAEMLFTEPFLFVCRLDHRLAGKSEVVCDDQISEALVRVCTQTGHRLLIDTALGARREMLKWQYEVQHASTAMKLVKAGLAVTLLPKLTFEVMQSSDLVGIQLRCPSLSRNIGLVTKRGATLSPSALSFRKVAIQACKRRALEA